MVRTSERAIELLGRIYDAAGRRRSVVLGALLLLTVLAGVRLATTRFDTSIDSMLPERGGIVRSIQFLRSGKLGENVVISLSRDPETTDVQDLHAAIDLLAGSVGPPLVLHTMAQVPVTAIESDLDQVLRRLPEVVTADDLAAVDARLTPEGIDAAVRRSYRQMLQPQTVYATSLVSRDPLGIGAGLLRDVGGLVGAIGYGVEIEQGHLVSPDRTRALLILETSVRMTDSARSTELLDYLDEALAALPVGISADVICGHAHTVENERTLRRDLRVAASLAGVGFLALFLFCFRDVRAVAVFVIPIVAVLIAMAGVASATGGLTAFVVGIGSVGAGISVDYGIHAYVAVRHGADGRQQIMRVARPIVLGALTTSSAFVAFLFSSTPGYRELAWFAVPTIVIALCLSLFVLPHWLMPGPASPPERRRNADSGRDWWMVAALVCALSALGVGAAGATFDSDLTQLDGAGPAVLAAEQRFREAWVPEEGEPAMLVIERADYQVALDAGRRAGLELIARIGSDGVVVTPLLWPSEARRMANVARWRTFWAGGRAEAVRALLAQSGERYGFSEDAFEPFLAMTQRPVAASAGGHDEAFFDRLRDRFIVPGGVGWRAVTTFPERAECRAAARDIASDDGNGFVVSRKELTEALSRSVTEDLTRIGAIALVLVLVVIVALVRSPAASAIVLLPAVAGCMAVAAASTVRGVPMNVASLIAGIVVLGLCIDYGVFMFHAHGAFARATISAVTLSAASTLVGSGALIFTDHPALASIGTTLTTGVAVGYVVAVVAVPTLARLARVQSEEMIP